MRLLRINQIKDVKYESGVLDQLENYFSMEITRIEGLNQKASEVYNFSIIAELFK